MSGGMAIEDAQSVAAADWFARRALADADPQGLDAWLADTGNRAAFARAEAIWADLDAVVRRPAAPAAVLPFPQPRPRPAWLVPALSIAASLLLVLVTTLMLLPGGQAFETRVGEQRTIVLEDDSRLMLNTDTRVVVRYARNERVVRLERGEASFKVAPDASRPFLVRAGDDEVRAVGTEFLVRRDGERVAVTLLEGKVLVTQGGAAAVALTPGERVMVGTGAGPRRDRPRIDSITAWQRGEMILYDTPIAEAVREMNRYSNLRVELEARDVADAKLTGVFKLGRTVDFARTLSALYDLRLSTQGERLVLREQPQKN